MIGCDNNIILDLDLSVFFKSLILLLILGLSLDSRCSLLEVREVWIETAALAHICHERGKPKVEGLYKWLVYWVGYTVHEDWWSWQVICGQLTVGRIEMVIVSSFVLTILVLVGFFNF
jgi:hypothetical protein